ncbi:MAG TPA: tetratricopeptide repeat protein [Terriglobia bacterium]|nr:tetratricopeptide repeat protein [Terriglobia bacterium]
MSFEKLSMDKLLRSSSIRILLVVLIACALLLSTAAGSAPAPESLLAQGRVDEAISSLRSELSGAPDDAHSYNLLCRAYFQLDEWDEAVKFCKRAVSLEPSDSSFHLWLGRAYGEKARHAKFLSAARLAKKVRNEFEIAVRLDPTDSEARADLARYYVEAPGVLGGGEDKAKDQARQLAALDPAEGEIVEAWIAEKNKDLPAAENHLLAAVNLSGGKPGVWLSLAEFYRRAGHADKMQAALEHALAAANHSEILMEAAQLLIDSKRDPSEAIELLRQYLSGPTVEEAPAFQAQYLLGTLYEKDGNAVAAAEEFRSALTLAKGYTPAQRALDRLGSQAQAM